MNKIGSLTIKKGPEYHWKIRVCWTSEQKCALKPTKTANICCKGYRQCKDKVSVEFVPIGIDNHSCIWEKF